MVNHPRKIRSFSMVILSIVAGILFMFVYNQSAICLHIYSHSDDTDSLQCIVTIYQCLIFAFGYDQDDLVAWQNYQKYVKNESENKLISNKKHFIQIHLERIKIQHMRHILGNTL